MMKSLRQYFKFHSSFKGRINRKTYISITLKETLFLFLYFCVAVLGSCLEHQVISQVITTSVIIIFFLICISVYVSQSACVVKRLHDLNLSGYWVLLASILVGVSILVFKWSGDGGGDDGIAVVQLPPVTVMIIGLVFLFVFLYLFLLVALLTKGFGLMFEWSDITVIKLPPVVGEVVAIFVQLLIICSIICLFFLKGTKRDNKYGPDPLQTGNLNIPKLPKKVLLWIVGLPVIFLITLSSTIVIKKGFKGGLEEVQRGVERALIRMEKKEIKKTQDEFLEKGILKKEVIEENVKEGIEGSVKKGMEENVEEE